MALGCIEMIKNHGLNLSSLLSFEKNQENNQNLSLNSDF